MQVIQNNRCPFHSNYDLQFVSVNKNSSQHLLCSVCLLKQQKVDSYLYIQDILLQDDYQPIQNWPLDINNNQLEYLSTYSKTNKQEVIKNKIIRYYETLQDQISQAIKHSQQEELSKIDKYEIGKNELIEFYNKQFQRNELKKYFEECKKFDSNKFNDFLGKVDSKRKVQLQQLQQMINRFDDVDNHIFFEQAQYIQRIICDLITNINFFSLEIQKIDQQLDQKTLIQSQNDIGSQEKKYFDLIKNINEAKKKQNAFLKSIQTCEWDSNQTQTNIQNMVTDTSIKFKEQADNLTQNEQLQKNSGQKIQKKKTETCDGWKIHKFTTEEKALKLQQFNDQSSSQSDDYPENIISSYHSRSHSHSSNHSDSDDSDRFCERFKKTCNLKQNPSKLQQIQKKK